MHRYTMTYLQFRRALEVKFGAVSENFVDTKWLTYQMVLRGQKSHIDWCEENGLSEYSFLFNPYA